MRLILLPFKIAAALFNVSFRAGFRVARVAGFRAWVFFGLGIAVGLLLAPVPGRELRHKLQKLLLAGAGESDAELSRKVGFELAHAPRTWHLPQPGVTVEDGRVRLHGTVASEEERDELGRVAAAIPGVAGVDNLLNVVTHG